MRLFYQAATAMAMTVMLSGRVDTARAQQTGSHTSPIPGDAPVVDLAAMLIAQPRRSHRCMQKYIERELGLADLAVSTYFSSLTRGRHSEERYKNVSSELAAPGVYRILGSQTPRRVWWLAFTDKGGALPRFNAREDVHSFTAEEVGSGEETIGVPLAAGKVGDEGGPASGIPRREGHCATGTAARGSVVGTD